MPSDKYRQLAKYFDLMFEFRRPYDSSRAVIVEPLLPGVKAACDLACGTGSWALELASNGTRTYAVDLSPDMCRITRAKARGTGLPVHVIEADMRSFRLPEPVDLVTCEFDAINHVPRKSDLLRVTKSVARALRPGGHFVFDANNRLAFEKVWGRTWFVEKDAVVMVMHGGHKPGTDRAWTDVEWFVRDGRCWRRSREHIEEVCWSAAEVQGALEQAGFDRVRAWDAAPFFNDGFTRRGYRTFWRARKALR